MDNDKIEILLKELSRRTQEPVRNELSDNIKNQIPEKLVSHKGFGNINIIIDLRINKLAAAAIIIISTLLCANFFAKNYYGDTNLLQDSKYLIGYLLGDEKSTETTIIVAKTKYETLLSMGVEAVYYGDNVKKHDPGSILLQWKIGENMYKVMFADMSEKEVSAQELIKLQSNMLKAR